MNKNTRTLLHTSMRRAFKLRDTVTPADVLECAAKRYWTMPRETLRQCIFDASDELKTSIETMGHAMRWFDDRVPFEGRELLGRHRALGVRALKSAAIAWREACDPRPILADPDLERYEQENGNG